MLSWHGFDFLLPPSGHQHQLPTVLLVFFLVCLFFLNLKSNLIL